MNRTFSEFPIEDFSTKKLQMLNWANRFNICCFLDNNQYQSGHHSVECLLGAGVVDFISAAAGNAFNELEAFGNRHKDWLFGHLGYDLKNETEDLKSGHPDHIQFPDLFFFVPEVVIELTLNLMRIGTINDTAARIFALITSVEPASAEITEPAELNEQTAKNDRRPIKIQERYSRAEYIETVNLLKQHILRGDCYEVNFCQEFFAENISLDPLVLYRNLVDKSPNPFSAFYKLDDKYLVCASPERYLKKEGRQMLSQPIKGTLKRKADSKSEALSRQMLALSGKDRSENVMVVDLVRNDLSRICAEGSVKVEELFGVYTFPQVYQMISTITGQLKSTEDWMQIIRATFPMGSMTGAPKLNVLKLIEKYERSKRGIFSGAVGYISPTKDFDFNVVIRSLIYNAKTGYLSFPAGSGITFYSEADAEYEECLLKIAAIRNILEDIWQKKQGIE